MSLTVCVIFEHRPGRIGIQTNTILATWKHVKVSLNFYNRQTNYIYYLSDYMLACLCRARAIEPFTMFLHVIRQTDRSFHPAHASNPSQTTPHSYVTFFLLHLSKLLHWSQHILSITLYTVQLHTSAD
jgi:hypothetical protein